MHMQCCRVWRRLPDVGKRALIQSAANNLQDMHLSNRAFRAACNLGLHFPMEKTHAAIRHAIVADDYVANRR
ncbi:hypothetical protein WOLCODRAFT_136321, partial [Wolfiporia cocos MD-104 SS10]